MENSFLDYSGKLLKKAELASNKLDAKMADFEKEMKQLRIDINNS